MLSKGCYSELYIKSKEWSLVISEAQARVARVETELKERAEQVEGLQNQLKQAQVEREQLMEASQNTEQSHSSEVTPHSVSVS